ncbi:MAG: cytochrome c biogenesis protein CcsA [Saprospiraceae bacterium]|nr:cytochrome c biogenesis protein CcsA [Saprospiraceae bacterium]
MKGKSNWIFSMAVSGMLMLFMAFAIGYATIIENNAGTDTAKILIYGAKWFDILWLLLSVNMIGSIFKYQLIKKRKWSILIFHIAFVIMVVGAGITRYIGFEGSMHIREGESSNILQSSDSYITIEAVDGNESMIKENKIIFTGGVHTKFSEKINFKGHKIKVKNKGYFPSAIQVASPGPDGVPILTLFVSGMKGGKQDIFIEKGEIISFENSTFGFENDAAQVNFKIINNRLGFTAKDSIYKSSMKSKEPEVLSPDSFYTNQQLDIFKIGFTNFIVKEYSESAVIKLVNVPDHQNIQTTEAFIAEVSVDGTKEEIPVYGSKRVEGTPTEVTINNIKIKVTYGAKKMLLPFSLKLNDFILERYPGSHSPSSFLSEVVVIDKEKNSEVEHSIFMNNVLNYRSYRFFQSSYDNDEKGTILSVNHDAWGTSVTYFGYFLMILGIIMALFSRKSRFHQLIRESTKLKASRTLIVLIIAVLGLSLSPKRTLAFKTDSITSNYKIDKEHAENFGKLLILDTKGRVKPVHTVASEVLRKLARKNSFNGLKPVEVFLGMLTQPNSWQNEKIIKVSHSELSNYLNISGKYASYSDFINYNGGGVTYKIQKLVEEANAKKNSEKTKFDKEVIKADEKMNLCYMIFSGTILNIYPVKSDNKVKWLTINELESNLGVNEFQQIQNSFGDYFNAVNKAIVTNNWDEANIKLLKLKDYQIKNGGNSIPSPFKIKLEILYNKYDVFKKLARYYGILGLILLVLNFILIFKPKLNLNTTLRISFYVVILLFIIHTLGLAARWYISGHAPWSNGYESMLYVAWATALSGLIFVRKSKITLAVTTVLSALILLIAGLSWMDPTITNLVPVLKSFWLIIHVAVITASYGFLALSALLGGLNLIIMIFRTEKNNIRLKFTIEEIALIIQMNLIIGLYLLTIGTFLGAIWANESWGRYWGWDPKETWALVSVIVYAFVGHMRKIPGFIGNYAISLGALLAFSSILMTYFGVNYILSGLHSYAGGEPVSIPIGVYYGVAIVAIISIVSYISELKILNLKKAKNNS